MVAEQNRVCVFIDNSNLFHTVRTLTMNGQRLDYCSLKDYLAAGRQVDVRFYYNLPAAPETLENFRQMENARKFLSNIRELGYTMIGVETAGGKEGGLELGIAYDMAVLSQKGAYHSFILVASDEVYSSLVRRVRTDTGMRVDVAFFGKCSTSLSREASRYLDLSKVSGRLFKCRKTVAV